MLDSKADEDRPVIEANALNLDWLKATIADKLRVSKVWHPTEAGERNGHERKRIQLLLKPSTTEPIASTTSAGSASAAEPPIDRTRLLKELADLRAQPTSVTMSWKPFLELRRGILCFVVDKDKDHTSLDLKQQKQASDGVCAPRHQHNRFLSYKIGDEDS